MYLGHNNHNVCESEYDCIIEFLKNQKDSDFSKKNKEEPKLQEKTSYEKLKPERVKIFSIALNEIVECNINTKISCNIDSELSNTNIHPKYKNHYEKNKQSYSSQIYENCPEIWLFDDKGWIPIVYKSNDLYIQPNILVKLVKLAISKELNNNNSIISFTPYINAINSERIEFKKKFFGYLDNDNCLDKKAEYRALFKFVKLQEGVNNPENDIGSEASLLNSTLTSSRYESKQSLLKFSRISEFSK